MMRRDVRIATVYKRTPLEQSTLHAMDTVRWLKISESLAGLGYSVDMIVNTKAGLCTPRANLRLVPFAQADWSRYHVIKTLFHQGFRTLLEEGVEDHPYIICKLGSVVGRGDDTPGVHFFGEERRSLYETQQKIHRRARYVTILTEASRSLWHQEFADGPPLLLVPTGVDRTIPPPAQNPYPASSERVAVYIGNIYASTQREVNLLWQERLNTLGALLRKRRIRLFFVGPGRTDRLDDGTVTAVGSIPYDAIWNYHYFAHVGLALAQGPIQHNESSKIYQYLRAGLPAVSEDPIPNNYLIEQSGCGLVSPYGDPETLAAMIEAAAHQRWDTDRAVRYMLEHHTWDKRSDVYDDVIRDAFVGRN